MLRCSAPAWFSIPLAAALSAAFSLVPREASAEDSVQGTRGGDQMSERDHTIALTFDRGHATLVVRRTLHNGFDRHDEAQLWLDVPQGAVATGVRTLGVVDGKPRWFEGELLEAEDAAARYQELTGLGGYYPKDPVLLSWRDPTLLAMQVFPVEPGADKLVEYTLTMPAVWEAGRWVVELPVMGTSTLAPELTLATGERLDQIFVDGEVVGVGHQLELDRATRIELAPRDPAPVTLALASVDAGSGRHLVELDVTLAAKISELPKRAQIVVALDLSRSRDPDEIEAERSAAIATLEHFRDPALAAQVAVIGFDREVHELTGGFVDASEAITALTQASLTTRNGSEIGVALAHASALLAEHAPARAPRRIVLMTDLLTATRLTPDSLAPLVDRSKAIVHLVHIDGGAAELYREDHDPWSSLAARSEGVLWMAGAPHWDDPSAALETREVFEELARPVRIDDFDLDIEGLRFSDAERLELGSLVPTLLAEGEGLTRIGLSSSVALELSVTGRTWNHRFEQRQRSDARHGDLWSALVFGSGVLDQLSEPEMMVLAMRGKAVSPVTSYLAIEPGVRPSTEGIEQWERGDAIGLGNTGLFGSGRGGGGWGSATGLDPSAWLQAQLGEDWRRCGGTGSATITLETTIAEIVEVAVSSAKADANVEICMRQSTWSVELPGGFDQSFASWVVNLD